MPITVNSPYSGRPVKIRDEDLGRAVRDEEKRVFYVVPRSDGEGYYAAITRKGSPKDEQRYDALQAKMDTAQEQVAAQHRSIHDATGRPQRRPLSRLIFLSLLFAAILVACYAAYVQWGGGAWPTFVDEWISPPESLPTDGPDLLPDNVPTPEL